MATSKLCVSFTVRYRNKIRKNRKRSVSLHLGLRKFPLITLNSSAKNLNDLPPIIQRFRIRLMRFYYKIVFVHGSDMVAADALSRLPLPVMPFNNEASHIVEQHIDYILSSSPINDTSMTQIKEVTAPHPILVSVMIHC